jgi:alkylation response protein AidB-like acyl-CoA dehydrogenase
MDQITLPFPVAPTLPAPLTASLLARLAAEAARHDAEASFPEDGIAALREAGLLAAPLPRALGGRGWGSEPAGALPLLALLRGLGEASLAIGRLFEAHVNAIRLLVRLASPAQQREAAGDVLAGHLFALWVTDDPAAPLQLVDGTLAGGKKFCSGAGHVSRAVVTAAPAEGGLPRLLLVRLQAGEVATRLPTATAGLRAAVTGMVWFDGVVPPEGAVFGPPGGYLHEPDFSAGAWRASAVALGGLAALVAEARGQLLQAGRAGDALQQARMGRAFIALETARLWLVEAGLRAEVASGAADEIVAYVNLARTAVEEAALDAIRLVQRSLGLAAFLQGGAAERLARDLATYLRQPAPDAVLTEAAAYFLHHGPG